jgi:nucleotide-binding universal stress UspA family protein
MSTQCVTVIADDRPTRTRVAEWAACEALRRGLPLRIVRVAPPADHGAARHDVCRPAPATDPVAAELAHAYPGLSVDTLHLAGTAGRESCSPVRNAEMIVVGLAEGSGAAGPFPGPIVREVAAVAACPVVCVPGGPGRARPPYRPAGITVGVDARDPAAGAIDFAFGTARLREARLRVVHAWSLPPAAAELPFRVPEKDRATWEDHEVQLLSDVMRPWREKYPTVPVIEDVVLFSPAEALIRNPGDAELIVAGRGHPAVNGLSTTVDSLLRYTGCPVALVPQ